MLMRDHYAFSAPKNNCTIWRFVDFTKFVSLLENRKLFFPRADQFDDPYEGAWSRKSIELLHQSGGISEGVEQFRLMSEQQRKETFISCWHANEHESAAMWKLYLKSDEGVAIRSDYTTLAATLERSSLNVVISVVRYIDYDTVAIPLGNVFFPFIHKRLSFAHESELRAIVWAPDDTNRPQIPEGSAAMAVDANPEELIKSVYVAPTAQKWVGELVEQIVRRYALEIPVVRSSLYDRPTF